MRDIDQFNRGRATEIGFAPMFLSCGLCLGSAQTLAEADGPDLYQVVGVAADDVLNIRAEPTAHAAKVGEIPSGADCVRNLGCQGGLTFQEFSTLGEAERAARLKENPRWCRVEHNGQTGWVSGRYLAEGGCATP